MDAARRRVTARQLIDRPHRQVGGPPGWCISAAAILLGGEALPHNFHEPLRRDRLGQYAVHVASELIHVDPCRTGDDYNDGNIAGLSLSGDLLAHNMATHHRQLQVEHHGVRPLVLERLQRAKTIANFAHCEAGIAEGRTKELPEGNVVFDEEDRGHRRRG